MPCAWQSLGQCAWLPGVRSSARRSTVLGEVLPSGLQALGEKGHSSTVGFGHVLGSGV